MKERVKRKRQEQGERKDNDNDSRTVWLTKTRVSDDKKVAVQAKTAHETRTTNVHVKWQHQVSVFSCHKICENSLTLRGDVLSFATDATAGLAMTGLRSGAFVMRCSNSSQRCAVRDWRDGDAE